MWAKAFVVLPRLRLYNISCQPKQETFDEKKLIFFQLMLMASISLEASSTGMGTPGKNVKPSYTL